MNIRDITDIESINAEPIRVHRGEWGDGEVTKEGWKITIEREEPDPHNLEWNPNEEWDFTGEVVSIEPGRDEDEDELVIRLDASSEFVNVPEADEEDDEVEAE